MAFLACQRCKRRTIVIASDRESSAAQCPACGYSAAARNREAITQVVKGKPTATADRIRAGDPPLEGDPAVEPAAPVEQGDADIVREPEAQVTEAAHRGFRVGLFLGLLLGLCHVFYQAISGSLSFQGLVFQLFLYPLGGAGLGAGAFILAVMLRDMVPFTREAGTGARSVEQIDRRLAELQARRRLRTLKEVSGCRTTAVDCPASAELQIAVSGLLATLQQPFEVRVSSFDLCQALTAAHEQLVVLCRSADVVELDWALERLAQVLPTTDFLNAAEVAGVCGLLVERGGDAAIVMSPLCDRLEAQLAKVTQLTEGQTDEQVRSVGPLLKGLREESAIQAAGPVVEDFWARLGRPTPEEGRLAPLHAWMGLPAVAATLLKIVCLDKAARLTARAHRGLPAALAAGAAADPSVHELSEVLELVEECGLLLLHPGQRRGFRITVENIRNNFQLFTLLQGELPLHGLEGEGAVAGRCLADPLAALARGEVSLEAFCDEHGSGCRGQAAWGYYPWTALQPDGSIAVAEEDGHDIPGLDKPDAIVPLEGNRVVLLGIPTSAQTWEAAWVTPVHRAFRPVLRVTQDLGAAEVSSWLLRITRARR
jgi:hypothetical protein